MMIRNALSSDLIEIAELLLVVHQLHVNAGPTIYREISPCMAVEFLASRMAEKNAYLRVAESDSEILGYCSAAIRSAVSIPLFQPRQFIYVNEIVIRPASRRDGVGCALIADLRQLARQHDTEEIELDVRNFNSGAQAFFKSQGFELLGAKMHMRLAPR